MTLFRANWNRASALALEIETVRQELWEAQGDPDKTAQDIADIREELHALEHAMFLTGATSERSDG